MKFLILLTLIAAPAWGFRRGHISELPGHIRSSFDTPDHGPLLGTDFVFAIPNSHLSSTDQSYTETLTLTITNPGTTDGSITVYSSDPDFVNVTVAITKQSSSTVNITPPTLQTNYMDLGNGKTVYDRKALFVASNTPVSLVVSNFRTDAKGGDTFAVIPTCNLAQQYFMIGDQSIPNQFKANYTNIITLVGAKQNATVKLGGLLASSIEIGPGDTVTIATNLYVNSVIINSTAPIAVFSANVCGYSHVNPQACSYEAAMLFPTRSWGAFVPFYKLLPEDTGEVIVRFQYDKTYLLIDNEVYHTKPFYSDEYVALNITSGVYLQGSSPIDVTAIGNIANSGLGAPFFLHVPSSNNFITRDLTFATGLDKSPMTTHVVRITTDINYIGSFSVDGYAPNPLLYRRMGFSDYYFVDVKVTAGQHTISNPKLQPYSAVVYGYGPDQSYAFAPGVYLLRK
ncbi:unnamed protein product [Auanema sp. JU1783]|nr:unnamed protein product [Auanema sp. JU1783]